MTNVFFGYAAKSVILTWLATLELSAEPIAINTPPTMRADELPRNISLLGQSEFLLSGLILLFGGYVVFMQYRLLRAARPSSSPADIMRVFSITLILVGVCLAMTAGYRTEQVAPVLGIFGTVAGYLLGYMAKPSDKDSATSANKPIVPPPGDGDDRRPGPVGD